MKRILGVLGLLLGSVGGVAALTVAVLVWPVTRHYAEEADRVSSEVVGTIEMTETLIQPFEARIQDVTRRVTSFRQSATEVAMKGDQSDPRDLAKVETIVTELTSRLDQAHDWTTSLHSSASSLQSVTKLASAITFDEHQQEQLQTAINALKNVDIALDQVGTLLEQARMERDLQTQARNLAIVAATFERPLSDLNATVSQVTNFLSTARGELTNAREIIEGWKHTFPLLSTVVMVWIALGQFCLAWRGWVLCRSSGEK